MAESTEQPVQIAVENARKELSGVIQSLTTVLQAVAKEEKVPNGQDAAAAQPSKHSMAEVMQRVEKLRVAVDAATSAGTSREQAAQAREENVLPAEREALTRRRDELMEQVKEKNGKVKILIDDLRELHRDIAVFQSLYRPVPPQQRAR